MTVQRILQGIARVLGNRVHSPASQAAAEDIGSDDSNRPAGVVLGRFTPTEFRALRERFERERLAIAADCDTSAPPINDQGMFFDRHTISVIVREGDVERARELVNGWLRDIGHVDEKAAEPGATDNPDNAQRLRKDH